MDEQKQEPGRRDLPEVWTLYHVGTREIREPDVHYGRKNADFGQGFYLTPELAFARRWAGDEAVLNRYELSLDGLSVHRFTRDAAWFAYLFDNRRLRDRLEADVIVGPIANDTIFNTMGIFSSGFLPPEEALRLLRIGPEYTQVALKTERAAARLRWLGAEAIARPEEETRRREQEAYLQALGAAMAEHE